MEQAANIAFRPVEVLRRQPDFWNRIMACLPVAGNVEAEVQEHRAADAWRLSAEAAALQLLTLEAFASISVHTGSILL